MPSYSKICTLWLLYAGMDISNSKETSVAGMPVTAGEPATAVRVTTQSRGAKTDRGPATGSKLSKEGISPTPRTTTTVEIPATPEMSVTL